MTMTIMPSMKPSQLNPNTFPNRDLGRVAGALGKVMVGGDRWSSHWDPSQYRCVGASSGSGYQLSHGPRGSGPPTAHRWRHDAEDRLPVWHLTEDSESVSLKPATVAVQGSGSGPPMSGQPSADVAVATQEGEGDRVPDRVLSAKYCRRADPLCGEVDS